MKDLQLILLAVVIVIISLYLGTKESFTGGSFDALTDSIRERQARAAKIDKNVARIGEMCSPFQLPDMYNPKGDCSDPFSWGFLYSTGPNPHVYSDRPKPKVPTAV